MSDSKKPSLSANISGSVLVGLLANFPLIFILLLFIGPALNMDIGFENTIFISLLVTTLSSILIAIIDRGYRTKKETNTPSGVIPTLYSTLPWVLTSALLFPFTSTIYTVETYLLGASIGFIGGAIPTLAIETPWKKSMSDEEYRAREEEVNLIIKEGFSEIREEIRERKNEANCKPK